MYTIIIPSMPRLSNCHLSILFLLFVLSSCSLDSPPLKDYYFPVEDMTEGRVYRYDREGKGAPQREYWHIQSSETDSGFLINTRILDINYYIQQEKTELQVPNGILLLNSTYVLDQRPLPIQRIPLEVQRDNAFPYAVPDSGQVHIVRYRYQEPSDSSFTTTLTRLRRYKGIEPYDKLNFKGNAAVFHLTEYFENEGEGVLTLEIEAKEYWLDSVGLVAWEKIMGPRDTIRYHLTNWQTVADFEKTNGKITE